MAPLIVKNRNILNAGYAFSHFQDKDSTWHDELTLSVDVLLILVTLKKFPSYSVT